MPNLYRTLDGQERRPGTPLSFWLADGTLVEAVWAGSAQEEKLDWWTRPASGNRLAQSEPIAAVASKADDDGEMIWGDAPAGAHLLFVLETPSPGKNYQLAKLVTTAATPAQTASFRHDRAALFANLHPDGTIQKISPLSPPPPKPPAQGELF